MPSSNLEAEMQNDAKRQKLTNQKPKIGESQNLTRTQRNEDVILILKSIIEFKAQHGGSNPSLCNMKPLYDSIKPKLHQYFDYNMLYNKIGAIKRKYEQAVIKGVGPTEFDREMFELSVRMWDQDGEVRKKMEARKKEAACNDFVMMKDEMNKHWEDNGLCKKVLEMGLELMDKDMGRTMEKKWRAFARRNAKVKKARLELEKEILNFMDSELGEGEIESERADEGESLDDGEGSDDSEDADDNEGDM